MVRFRVGALLLALVVLGLSTGPPYTAGTYARDLQTGGLPDGVRALLPDGAVVTAAQAADLTGNGGVEWAVVYSPPGNFSGTLFNPELLIAAFDGTAWTAASEFPYQDLATQPRLSLVGVAGTTAVAFAWYHGAHGAALAVVRWDGAAFVRVFNESTDAPGPAFADIDGDGVLEIVDTYSSGCLSNGGGPELVNVFHWDGVAFSPATAPYPLSVLADSIASIRQAFQNPYKGTEPRIEACLDGTVAYVAGHGGDANTAAVACDRAAALDPVGAGPYCGAWLAGSAAVSGPLLSVILGTPFEQSQNWALDAIPADEVAAEVLDAIRSNEVGAGRAYAGDCRLASVPRDSGALCSLVFFELDGSIKAVVGLPGADGGVVLTLRADGGHWAVVRREAAAGREY